MPFITFNRFKRKRNYLEIRPLVVRRLQYLNEKMEDDFADLMSVSCKNVKKGKSMSNQTKWAV